MVAVLVVIMMGGIRVGSAVVARHRAQAAADLAALAAAQRLPAGLTGACSSAEALAAAMGAVLEQCSVDGLDVVLSVGVTGAAPLGGRAEAWARAGPV